MIIGVNVRHKTMNIPEENSGSNLFNLGYDKFLADASPEARETK